MHGAGFQRPMPEGDADCTVGTFPLGMSRPAAGRTSARQAAARAARIGAAESGLGRAVGRGARGQVSRGDCRLGSGGEVLPGVPRRVRFSAPCVGVRDALKRTLCLLALHFVGKILP